MNTTIQTVIFLLLLSHIITTNAENAQKQPTNVSYTRLYIDDAGESHFTEAEIPMSLTSYAQPEPKVGLSSKYDASSVTFLSAPPGYYADWHTAVKKQFLFHLAGTTEIVVSDGEKRLFKTGDILLVEDTSGKGHTARVIGDKEVTIAAVPAVIGQ